MSAPMTREQALEIARAKYPNRAARPDDEAVPEWLVSAILRASTWNVQPSTAYVTDDAVAYVVLKRLAERIDVGSYNEAEQLARCYAALRPTEAPK